MKLVLWITLLLLLAGTCSIWAYDTYFFRVSVSATRSVAAVRSTLGTKGRKSEENQPFLKTHVLQQPDTNYILLQMTPTTPEEFQEVRSLFGMQGVELWRQYRITEEGPDLIVDNSTSVRVDRDWSVEEGSGTRGR